MRHKSLLAFLLSITVIVVSLTVINEYNNLYVNAEGRDDEFNLHTYMADNILCKESPANRSFAYYYSEVKSTAEIWNDSVTPEFKASVEAWENINLALSPDELMSKAIDAKGYYMTVILSMFQATYEKDRVIDKLVNKDVKNASKLYNGFAKLFKEMSNSDIESYLSKGSFSEDERALLNAVQKRFLENNKFLSAGKTANEIIDMIDIAQKPSEYMDKFMQYCNMYQISNEWKECLQAMYDKTSKDDDSPLCQALETLIFASKDINNAVYQIWADGLEEITNEFYKVGVKKLIEVVTDACPLIKGMKIGQTIGKSFSNLLFSTDKVIEGYYVIKAYCNTANLFRLTFNDTILAYKNNRTEDNAQKFLTYLDLYFDILITGNEFGQDFTDVMYKKGIVSLLARSGDEYKTLTEQTKKFTEYFKEAYEKITTLWLLDLYEDNAEIYEIYANALGDDATVFLPVSRVEFEKESVEWGLQDFGPTGYKCTVYPENATLKDLIYTSSDSSVAEITNEGVLKLNGMGNCVITVKSVENENIYDTLSVTVVKEGGADSFKQTIFPFETMVPESSDNDFEYIVNDDNETVTVTGYTGDGIAVTIPKEIDGKVVTSIGRSAFEGCTSLASIVIPDSVTSIGWSAFEDCTSLASIVIPDSVTSIGWIAFKGCTSLASIVIPDSVTSIDGYAFEDCTSLVSIVIPDSVIWIDNYAFQNCTSVASIVIPDSVTQIGIWAFRSCTSLASIVISNSVTSIDDCVFKDCTSLTSIVIPDSVTSIGFEAFRGCTSLDSVVIPDNVTSIGRGAFSYCTSLASIVIPDSVTSIGGWAFEGCTSLASIVIPDSVTSIGDNAFRVCTSLASIIIPNSITSIGGWTFEDCTSLASIVIPDSVTSIGNGVFSNCKSLASIVIPDSVTSIGDFAFFNCCSLTSIVIPDSVTSIGEYAFANCNLLTIYGIAGSYAQEYANVNSIEFVILGSEALFDTETKIFVMGDNLEKVTLTVTKDETSSTSDYIAYNITLTDSSGSEIQPAENITVKIPVPEEWNGETCKVYREEKDSTYTDMNAVHSDGYMVFKTDHFSKYILSMKALIDDSGETNPETTTESETEPVTTSETETEPVTTSETETEPPTTSETETEPVTTSETETEPVTTSETEAEPVITSETETEPVITSETETEPVTTSETETEPVTTLETETELAITTESETESIISEAKSLDSVSDSLDSAENVSTTTDLSNNNGANDMNQVTGLAITSLPPVLIAVIGAIATRKRK